MRLLLLLRLAVAAALLATAVTACEKVGVGPPPAEAMQ
jgi:hypothetical protein